VQPSLAISVRTAAPANQAEKEAQRSAEVWRELFNAEAVATRVIVLDSSDASGDLAPRQIWVPDSKTHVALEIMRKV
jgi:hypothetical protein